MKTVIGKIVVGGFLLAMVGSIVAGIVFLAWPSLETHADGGQEHGRQEALAHGGAGDQGQGQGRGAGGQGQGQGQGRGAGGPGLGQDQERDPGGPGRGQEGGQGFGREDHGSETASPDGLGRGQGQGAGRNRDVPQGEPVDLETVEGTVVEIDELVVETVDGQTVQIGLGPSSYREGQGFVLSVGDRVLVSGYWEADEYKATQVDNLDTGEGVELRDISGRPMWAGQGRRAGQGQ